MTQAIWWHDTARFGPDDPDALVAAAFMCPLCLHTADEVTLWDGDDLPDARCLCEPCGTLWSVGLDAEQLLRLTLDPPPDLWLRWDAGARFVRGRWGFVDDA
jgi:hypothetical protein